MSIFNDISYVPPDAIFELTKAYNADPNPLKVNLGQGTYKDGEGKPWVLPSVFEAKERLKHDNHEYLPILGLPAFRESASALALGLPAGQQVPTNVASCQALSGTGALHLAGSFLRRAVAPDTIVYITDPSWSNHRAVFETCGFKVKSYKYFDPKTCQLDYQSVLSTIKEAPQGSIFVFHACAHNPSGCDPSSVQWKEIAEVMKERKLFPLFDAAYLGLTSGDFDQDAWAIRFFINEMKMEVGVCLSFAKNMGLYGERVGLLMFISSSAEAAKCIQSNLEQLQRAEVSNPPAYGAKIASTILKDAELSAQWRKEHVVMSTRISEMRRRLLGELIGLGCPRNFQHVVDQIGMFCILGLTPEQVKRLQDEHHIYMADSSRISVAGLNESNVAYVAKALDIVVRE